MTVTKGLMPGAEWIEADGLGGFASGTAEGIRTRRYHAALLVATAPPSGRMVLVNGFDAGVETTAGWFALSTQRYVFSPEERWCGLILKRSGSFCQREQMN
jgi:glycogen debranching enzyme